ncbi:hypothetical protein PF007_g33051, partial [Phytophthora fragariae]
MIGAASPVLIWCCTSVLASGGHPGFLFTISAYWRSTATTKSLSAGSISPICSLASSVSGAASSLRSFITHSFTRSRSNSPLIDSSSIVSSVGTQVPNASRAGSFSRFPST